MIASGAPITSRFHAYYMVEMAFDMLEVISNIKDPSSSMGSRAGSRQEDSGKDIIQNDKHQSNNDRVYNECINGNQPESQKSLRVRIGTSNLRKFIFLNENFLSN